ncbi:MAG TPA: phage major capsid protein [Candidatus Limivivens intestinipullorum]|uniref:Phage major capsid protein n=1 Tax=Candidatus Limivivens intestinipullorum TaxID=2840858 RepID=A0A9D1ESL1_9FIRM|nr:phage major capsid protein [Candidatus Limivivens intestinipullorum]
MALKQIMLRKKIDMKRSELNQLISKDADFATREAELETAIGEATTEEEQTTVTEQVEAFETEKKEHEEAKTALEEEIAGLEEELAAAETDPPQDRGFQIPEMRERRERTMPTMNINIRSLPMNVRAFDALPMEQREQIVKRSEVKAFLDKLRSCKGSNRAISGAELEIPIVFLELISENMYRYSKLLNRVRVRSVRGEARQTIAGTVPEAIWTEMCGAINELSFVFNQITMDGYKVAGYVPVCNSLLEDTDIDLASWIIEMLAESNAYATDKAILYGKGGSYNMPMGIVTRLVQDSKPSNYPANAPAWVDLHTSNLIKIDGASMTGAQFWAALVEATGNTFNRYARGTMFWAMNSKTYAKLKSKLITFTATGDIVANLFGTLPIVTGDVDILEFIPDNDIIGGYGDLYLWIDRASMVIDQSEHVKFIQDNTIFRGKARADGQPVIPQAFVGINIANTAVTTAIDFAADTANDADLQALSVGTNTLSPAFNADILAYTIATANADTAKVEATTVQPGASVEIAYNGQNVRNGGTATLLKDGQPHPLTVTVKNGNAVKVYTINITRASG